MDKVIISRMVMNFKVDSEDRIWFIFASSLRLDLGDEVYELFFMLVKLILSLFLDFFSKKVFFSPKRN